MKFLTQCAGIVDEIGVGAIDHPAIIGAAGGIQGAGIAILKAGNGMATV
jgi:hypothetical protein